MPHSESVTCNFSSSFFTHIFSFHLPLGSKFPKVQSFNHKACGFLLSAKSAVSNNILALLVYPEVYCCGGRKNDCLPISLPSVTHIFVNTEQEKSCPKHSYPQLYHAQGENLCSLFNLELIKNIFTFFIDSLDIFCCSFICSCFEKKKSGQ